MHNNRERMILGQIILQSSNALNMAKNAHDHILGENSHRLDVPVALAFCNQACATINLARALFYTNPHAVYLYGAENFFHRFEVFVSEMMSNVSTDHSHQWTATEFDRLVEAFEQSALNQPANKYLE